MLDVIVELFAIGMLLAVAFVGFFMMLNLRKASEERDPLTKRYLRAKASAETERRFTTQRPFKTVRKNVERHAKKIFGASRIVDDTVAKEEVLPVADEAKADQKIVVNEV